MHMYMYYTYYTIYMQVTDKKPRDTDVLLDLLPDEPS